MRPWVQDFGRLRCGAAAELVQLVSHGGKLPGGHTRCIAGLDQRAVELLRFSGALGIAVGQHASGSSGQREGVDKAGDVPAHGSRCWADATEDILQLPTLLQQHGQRRLTALQAREDVGELRRQLLQRGARLLRTVAQVAKGQGCRALRLLNRAQLVDVGLERLLVDAAHICQGIVEVGRTALAGLGDGNGALNAGRDALGGLVNDNGTLFCALPGKLKTLVPLFAGPTKPFGHLFSGFTKLAHAALGAAVIELCCNLCLADDFFSHVCAPNQTAARICSSAADSMARMSLNISAQVSASRSMRSIRMNRGV